MSSYLYLPVGNAPLLFIGRLQWEDKVIPVPGKDEWGVDTLNRIMHMPSYLLPQFLAQLMQGGQITDGPSSGKYNSFYLQSWQPSAGPHVSTVNMLFKGLTTGQLPATIHENTLAQLTGTLNASGLNVQYNGQTIVSATREIKYTAPRTIYRFITNKEPADAVYDNVAIETKPIILESRVKVTFDDGTTQTTTGSLPSSVMGSLQGVQTAVITGPAGKPLVGTPYWQCETTVELRLEDGPG